MKLSSSRALVTGAGGFIGSHIVEALVARGARVRALVHYNSRNDWGNLELLSKEVLGEVEVVPGDIQDPRTVRSAVAGCDTVFHLAALIGIPFSYQAPNLYLGTNVGGTLNILEACRAEGVGKLVHTSTSEVYGTARFTPIHEEHQLQAQSPYSASKIAADKLVESYHLSFNVPAATIRPFNTYGPRQSARSVIPTIITQCLSGRSVVELGSLNPVRDLTFVADTVEGFLRVAESDKAVGQVINIGAGEGTTIGMLAAEIIAMIGKSCRVVSTDERVRPPQSEVLELICDNRKAQALLGWLPSVSRAGGLLETVRFIEKHLHRYKPALYNV